MTEGSLSTGSIPHPQVNGVGPNGIGRPDAADRQRRALRKSVGDLIAFTGSALTDLAPCPHNVVETFCYRGGAIEIHEVPSWGIEAFYVFCERYVHLGCYDTLTTARQQAKATLDSRERLLAYRQRRQAHHHR
jgi:hypothetical protein